MLINPWARIASDLKALYFVIFFQGSIGGRGSTGKRGIQGSKVVFSALPIVANSKISKRRTIQYLRSGNTITNTCFKQTQFLVAVKVHVSS